MYIKFLCKIHKKKRPTFLIFIHGDNMANVPWFNGELFPSTWKQTLLK